MTLLRESADESISQRGRRARVTAVTNVLFQGSILSIGLISVPLSLAYLGTERYGIWLTLNSLLTWLALSDMGWGGNALINALAAAHGRDDLAKARELVSTAFLGLCAIALGFALLFFVLIGQVSMAAVFNASRSVPDAELRRAVSFAFIAFAASFPAGVVQAVFHGYQRGYWANAWNILGSLLGLVALVMVTRVGGDLPRFVLALWGVRAAMALLAIVLLFVWIAPWLAPSPRFVSREALSRLGSLGVRYFVAQLAGLGMFHSQPLIIAHQLGPAQVGIFNVAQRILTLPWSLSQMIASPLLPAYGEARARRDWGWIRKAVTRSLLTSAVIGIAFTVPLALGVRKLVGAWIGPTLVPSPGLVLSLGAYTVVASLAVPLSVLLYGLEAVGGQAKIALLTTMGTIGLGLWMSARWGLAGLGWAMTISFCLNLLGQILQAKSVLPKIADR